MPNPDSDQLAELARCIAEAQGALTEAQLLALFEFLFKPCAHRREWEPFRAAYVAALCESAPVQPSVVVEMGARPQGGTLTAVGIMTLAWSAAPRLELLDLFCQII